jgi:hypothetical protein
MVRKLKTKKTANFFIKFWYGDLSLPMSYWLVGVVFGLVVGFSIGMIAYSMGMPEAAINFLILPWAIYSTVGIWRSSDKYKGSKFWAVLTKILIVIGVISYFSGLISAIN